MNDTTRNLILPLEFGLEIYSDYEQVFVRMKFRDNQDKKIQRKHRWRVIRTCKLSLRKILLFRKEYVNKMYGLMSEETFDNIMREFKEEEYFPQYVKAHIDRGSQLLLDMYNHAGSMDKYILQVLGEGDTV